MDLLHYNNKNIYDQCGEKFGNYDDLIKHALHIHHHTIVKCQYCGKEFIHEKDRLHHAREEHEKELVDYRIHKDEYKGKTIKSPQEEVNEHMRNFGDDLKKCIIILYSVLKTSKRILT